MFKSSMFNKEKFVKQNFYNVNKNKYITKFIIPCIIVLVLSIICKVFISNGVGTFSYINDLFLFITSLPLFFSFLLLIAYDALFNRQNFHLDTIFHFIAIVVGYLIFLALFIFEFYSSISYFKDIPYVITSNYSVAEGKARNIHYTRTKTKSIIFEVDNVEFSLQNKYSDFIIRNSMFTITYLPNTHYIIKISNN